MTDSTAIDHYHLGFDLGGTKMLAVVYNSSLEPIGRNRIRTHSHEGTQSVVNRIIENINAACAAADIASSDLKSIGIGVPGAVNMQAGTVLGAVNLGWQNVELVKILRKHFSCSSHLLNDVDAGVYGESQRGAAQGALNVIGVFPGTGIGGGAVFNGQIVTGRQQTAMEIGHIQVVPNGIPCPCGQQGCLETVASRLAIASQAIQAAYRGAAPSLFEAVGTDLRQVRSGVLSRSVANGDKAVEDIIRSACGYLGQAIATLVSLFAPDMVILGGGLVEAMPELIVDATRLAARERSISILQDSFEVCAAELGDDASVLGAAIWGANEANK
jgi:glucokinase